MLPLFLYFRYTLLYILTTNILPAQSGGQKAKDIPDDRTFPPGYDGLGTAQIYGSGNSDQEYDEAFFEPTEANIKASMMGEAYVNWYTNVSKSGYRWEHMDYEAEFFVHSVLEWPMPVECGISLKGCRGLPTCREVNARLGNREHARQICYVLSSMRNINLIPGNIHVRPGIPFSCPSSQDTGTKS